MKTIIIATDYSAVASNALQYAANLACVVNADLVLFNTYHLSGHASNALITPMEIDRMVSKNEKHMQELANETAQKYHLNVTWVSKMNDTVEELEKYVNTHSADLVVMGMESNLIEYTLFGNTTTKAIQRLKFPVLVVPNDVPFKPIERILYAYDQNFLDQHNHLDLMKEIARKFEAKLQVFHVETKTKDAVHTPHQDQAVGTIDHILEDVDHTYSIVENPRIAEGIIHEVEVYQADILAMVPHKQGFLESLLKGSTTRKMALTIRIPLLVLPNINVN
ncbi:universal stress protein [Reichenbachiella sp. MALMAid0571]|uniref:universal stress protein n=1 Tax=Reichenbachiella sp. MALMAid0571 TaxID=3143939 RepID=UPI0032DFEE6B